MFFEDGINCNSKSVLTLQILIHNKNVRIRGRFFVLHSKFMALCSKGESFEFDTYFDGVIIDLDVRLATLAKLRKHIVLALT